MTFPTVATIDSDHQPSNSTTYDIAIPAVSAGQIVIIQVTKDDTPAINWPSSPAWTMLGTDGDTGSSYTAARWRRIDGTEGWGSGGQIQVNADEENWAHVLVVINDAHDTTDPVATGGITGVDDSPDPPRCPESGDLAWGTEDTLWIATYGWDGNVAHSAYPANYTDNQITERAATTGGCGVALATRNLAAAFEDPGVATLGAIEQWRSYTIAVRPADSTGTGSGSGQIAGVGFLVGVGDAPSLLPAPENVQVVFTGTTEAKVTWDAVDGADIYQVEARVRPGIQGD